MGRVQAGVSGRQAAAGAAVGRVSPAQRTPQTGRFSPFAGCRTEGGKPTRAQDIQLARTSGARRTGPGPRIRHGLGRLGTVAANRACARIYTVSQISE